MMAAAVMAASLGSPGWALGQDQPAPAPAPAPAAAAPVEAANILDAIPAGAQMVVLVPNLSALSADLAKLNDATGMAAPVLADALGEFKRSMGMNKGINDAGAMAFVVQDLAAAQRGEPVGLLLMPVNNYADFVSNFGTNKVDGSVELALPTGHTAFARQVSGYAVLSRDAALLEAYKPGGGQGNYRQLAGKLASGYLDSSDLVMLADMRAIAPTVLPMLEEGQAEAMRQMDAQALPNAGMAKAMLTMYFDAARAILNDGNAALVGFDVADAGVGMTFGAQFKPDSGVAKMLGEGGGTGSETLKQLPNQPYLMAAAMDLRTLGVAALLEKMAARLADPSVGWVGELIRGALPMMKSVKTMSQAYYVPTQIGFNSSLLNGVAVIDAGQGAAFRDAYRAYVAKMDQMKMNLGPMPGADGRVDPNAPPAIISVSAQYTDNALQVDGIAVDQYAINYTLPPQMMQQMGQAAGMMMMMGGTNQTGYLAVKDQYAIVTTAPDAQLVKAALASVKAGNGLSGQATIGQVNEHLTPKPSAVGYVSVSGIAQTVNQFMMVMGAGGGQPMLEVPADLPPVAFSMSVQDSGVAKRLFVPMPVISFASQTAQNMMGQMNAGEAEQPNNGGNAPPRQGPPPAPR